MLHNENIPNGGLISRLLDRLLLLLGQRFRSGRR
jgi:hypothetical protein